MMSADSGYQVPDTAHAMSQYLEGVDELDFHTFADRLVTGLSGEIPNDRRPDICSVGTPTAVSATDGNSRLYDLDSQHIVPAARSDIQEGHVMVRDEVDPQVVTYTVILAVQQPATGSTVTGQAASSPIPIPSKSHVASAVSVPSTDQAWLSETFLPNQSLLSDVAPDNASSLTTSLSGSATDSAVPDSPDSYLGHTADTALSPTYDVMTSSPMCEEGFFLEETWGMSDFQLLPRCQLQEMDTDLGLTTNGTNELQRKITSVICILVII